MPIYMARVDGSPFVKIGFASDPVKRINILQTAHVATVRMIRLLDGTEADERRLHRRFASFLQRGEWFAPSNDMLAGDLGLIDLPLPALRPVRVAGQPRSAADRAAISAGHARARAFREAARGRAA